MKVFQCDFCGSLVFFENFQCVKCGRRLGFLPDSADLSTLEPAGNDQWKALTPKARKELQRQCRNGQQEQICNWMLPADDPNPFCISCRLNKVVPDLKVAGNHERWHKLELAKRRIIYTILRLGLPMEAVPAENRPALRFSFLGDATGRPRILDGHLNGLITINIAETDDDKRELMRVSLHEPYRTLLGHLRHEIAHYYWDRLIANSRWLDRFRGFFGDETKDYEAALKAYYERGSPPDWQSRFVSAYATAHPWEDWAESWAHYLHIVDTVETAASFGMTLRPNHPDAKAMTADPQKASGPGTNFDRLLENWFPLTYALNTLNRGMGLLDLYPFVLSSVAIEKLRFIHEVIESTGAGRTNNP